MAINIRGLYNVIFGVKDATPPAVRTAGGIDISYFDPSRERSLKVSSVFKAATLISEGVARLPLSLQRWNDARGCFVDYCESPVYTSLRVKPNNMMTSFEMWRVAMLQVLLQGNAYMYPKKNAYGDVISLALLTTGSVSYDPVCHTYQVDDAYSGIKGTFRDDEIVHLCNIDLDGKKVGISTLSLAGEAMGILRLGDSNIATTLSNGGRMRGILSGSAGVETFAAASSQQLKNVSEGIEEDIRAGRTVIPVPQDMKFQSITLSPADAKVIESKQVTIRDIARFFRVHPSLLYEESNNTYKAAEIPNVMFLVQTLEPLLVQIELELLTKLYPRELWGKYRFRFDREVMYSTDLTTKAQYYKEMLQAGVYTVNELRSKEGLSPLKGGDVPLVSANLRGLEELTNNIKNE